MSTKRCGLCRAHESPDVYIKGMLYSHGSALSELGHMGQMDLCFECIVAIGVTSCALCHRNFLRGGLLKVSGLGYMCTDCKGRVGASEMAPDRLRRALNRIRPCNDPPKYKPDPEELEYLQRYWVY